MYNLSRLSQWCVLLMFALIVAEIAFFGHTIAYWLIIDAVQNGTWTDVQIDERATLIDSVGVMITIGYMTALIACFVLNGIWIYRASSNAASFDADHQNRISPGWAVGWYFIPIANLFKPFQAMRQTWNGTFAPKGDIDNPAPGILVWWWTLWVLTNILGRVSYRFAKRDDLESLKTSSILDMISFPLSVLLTLIFITMIQRMTREQTRLINHQPIDQNIPEGDAK